MMHLKNVDGIHIAALTLLLIILSSCNQQLYRGFGYKGSAGAPDVGNLVSPVQEPDPHEADVRSAELATVAEVLQDRSSGQESTRISAVEAVEPPMGQMVMEEASRLAGEGREVNHLNLTKSVSRRLVDEGKISALSPAQERKMTRLAAKMDKKQKKLGKELDWKNNSGLELFFMIMSIGGLVLGIVGVGIGWFVFIVFAGLWLYFKLVRD